MHCLTKIRCAILLLTLTYVSQVIVYLQIQYLTSMIRASNLANPTGQEMVTKTTLCWRMRQEVVRARRLHGGALFSLVLP